MSTTCYCGHELAEHTRAGGRCALCNCPGIALPRVLLFVLLVVLAGACDCGRSHPMPDAGELGDAGPCGAGRVLCEGNCVEPTHPSCGDAS